MGIEALTHRDDGTEVAIPNSQEAWQEWVSAGRTRNWLLQDPLVDWLQLYGKDRGYIPKSALDGYDRNLDFVQFIFQRAQAFETGILKLLQKSYNVVTVAHGPTDIRSFEKAKETFRHMQEGAFIIFQGVLWDAHLMTYGSPDFLIRSDVLHGLFPISLSESEANNRAPDLGDANWHYCVVDTKFTTLRFNAAGTELTGMSAYKAQLFIYNRMLGRLQGFQPPQSFLLGRGWNRTSKDTTFRVGNAFDCLGPVPQSGSIANGAPIAVEVEHAIQWIRRVRTEGHSWELLPQPSVPELYPNAGILDDEMTMDTSSFEVDVDEELKDEQPGRWVNVKKWLANELKEITQLWQVGPGKRDNAHEAGILRWDDPLLTPSVVGVGGTKQGPTLQKILEVNTDDGPPIRPQHIAKTRDDWHDTLPVEFFVDFEFCSDLSDDFSMLPEKGGQPIIFMIGCGHLEQGEWRFCSFVVKNLTGEEEHRIIMEWVNHMALVKGNLDASGEEPRIFHWSPAEVTVLEKAFNSARARHGARATWPDLGWYDFLAKVMQEEPVVVRGALKFGLKAIANAMHDHGLIETNWAESPVDGLGAMVGAWRCEEERQRTGDPIDEMHLMQEIARYNEIDCKTMMEIVRYLRAYH